MALALRALLLGCAASGSAAAGAAFFAAPTGSDAAAGTRAAPFATLARAAAAARAAARDGDIVVYLRAGAYAQAAPLELTAADSGAPGATVRFVGGWPGDAPGAAVIHAGAAVAGWAPLARGAGGVATWSAPLPAGVADTRQLWRAGGGGARVPQAAAGGLGGAGDETDTGYTLAAAAAPWLVASAEQSVADIELLYTGAGSSWTESRLRAASAAALPGGMINLTMAQPAWSFHRRAYGQALPRPTSSANVFAALAPGSWTVNSATRTLYYAPLPGEAPAAAAFVVPTLDVLVNVTGAAWLSFEGLTFSYAGWLEPNSGAGYVDMQSGYRLVDPRSLADPGNDDLWVPVPGNIQFHGVTNVTVAGCTFSALGASALAVTDGSQSVRVVNSTFRDVSCAGVAMGQVSDVNATAAQEDAHFTIDGNLFDNIPSELHDCPAVLGGFVVDANITNNAILNASNGGVCWGWGWSRDEATNSGSTTIARNYVYRSNWLLEDCGSLYVLGPQPNSLMAENFLSSQVKLYGALYTDEGSAYWHITRNVVHNVPEWLRACLRYPAAPAPATATLTSPTRPRIPNHQTFGRQAFTMSSST